MTEAKLTELLGVPVSDWGSFHYRPEFSTKIFWSNSLSSQQKNSSGFWQFIFVWYWMINMMMPYLLWCSFHYLYNDEDVEDELADCGGLRQMWQWKFSDSSKKTQSWVYLGFNLQHHDIFVYILRNLGGPMENCRKPNRRPFLMFYHLWNLDFAMWTIWILDVIDGYNARLTRDCKNKLPQSRFEFVRWGWMLSSKVHEQSKFLVRVTVCFYESSRQFRFDNSSACNSDLLVIFHSTV